MFLFQQFLPGLLVAGLTSALLLGLSAWIWKRNTWSAAVAIGAGYFAGHVAVAGWPGFPPAEATRWMSWFALLATVAAVCDGLFRPEKLPRALLWSAICIVIVTLLVRPKFRHEWTIAAGLLWVGGLAGGMVLLSWCLEAVEPRPALPLTLTIVAAGTGAALMLSGSMLLSHFASVLSAATAALAAFTLLWPRTLAGVRSSAPPAAVLLASLWVSGYFYAELPAASAILLGLAPMFGSGMVRVLRLVGRSAVLAQTTAVAAITSAAVFIAFRASPPFPY